MKDLLSICVTEDGEVTVFSDFVFPAKLDRQSLYSWQDGLYRELVSELVSSSDSISAAIRLLEQARKDARCNYMGFNPEVEEALIAWRREKARAAGVAAYVIMPQRVLLAIADKTPTCQQELMAIPGFGDTSWERYGQELLELVAKHNPPLPF